MTVQNSAATAPATIRLGDVTIDRIIESEGPLFDPLTFFPSLTPAALAENRSWMEADGALADGKLVLCIQSYVVRTPHHTILIDTCVGNHKLRPTHPFWSEMRHDAYMKGLAGLGLRVEDIDFVMCTHLHVDHVGWNTRLENGVWVPTFPNARYVFEASELAYWTARSAETPVSWIVDSVLPIVAAGRTELVSSEHALNDHIRLEPTPGHSPHHFAVQIGRGKVDAVVSGDMIHSPLQARYPELGMRADYDVAQGGRTRRRFFECYCETSTLICTGHFPSPSTARISRWDDGFRFVTAVS